MQRKREQRRQSDRQEIPGTDTNEQNPGNIAVDGDTGGGSSVENTGETVTEVKHNPKLIHIETKCNKKTVEPGDKIKLELTFQNKSKKETIRNVALRVEVIMKMWLSGIKQIPGILKILPHRKRSR